MSATIDVAFSNVHVCNVTTVCGLNVQSKPNRIFLSRLLRSEAGMYAMFFYRSQL